MLSQDQRVVLTDATSFKIVMEWSSFEDLDLLLVYQKTDQEYGVVYFNETGDLSAFPYIAFEDIPFTSLDVENRESIVVQQMMVSRLWIFGWSFEHILESATIDFVENGLHISVQNGAQVVQTAAQDLGIGNLCRLGSITKDSDGTITFYNNSACFTVGPMEEIEQIFSYL